MAPKRSEDAEARRAQRTSWAAVNYLLRSGHSWSGRERNNCFVNRGDGAFSDISYLSGAGFVDDARGVGALDWDGDGDLDLWLNNRSSPKVRYLQNASDGANHWLALRMLGTRCNRDAVGARIELRLADGRVMIRTVHAGVNYTMQGTRWVHFGLGPDACISGLTVHWPDGSETEPAGVEPGRRYLVRQDADEAQALPPPAVAGGFPPASFEVPETSRVGAIPLGAVIPLPPDLSFVDFQGQRHRFGQSTGKPLLINLWASWCAACRAEFADFAAHREAIDGSGADVLACSVDKPGDRAAAEAAAKDWGLWFPAGPAPERFLELLDVIKMVVFDQYEDLPLPTSLLLDRDGRLARVYLGPLDPQKLAEDVRGLQGTLSDVDVLYQASAHPGGYWLRPDVWLVSQKGSRLIKMTQFLATESRPELAAFYAGALADYVDRNDPPKRAGDKAAAAILAAAQTLLAHDAPSAVALYRRVVARGPERIGARVGLTAALLETGTPAAIAEAGEIFDAVRPDLPEPVTPAELATYGVTFYRLGKTDEAIDYLQRAVDGDPDNVLVRAYLGSALVDVGRAAEGLPWLESTVGELEANYVVLRRLAQALDETGRSEDAQVYYEEAMRVAPKPETLDEQAVIGRMTFRLGRWKPTVAHLKPVVDTFPERWTERSLLGLSLAHLTYDAEALEHLEAALPHLPPDPASQYILGIVRARTGNLAGAITAFEKVLELDPDRLDALRLLALAHHNLRHVPQAIERFEAYLGRAPADMDVLWRLGTDYEAAGRLDDAARAYRRVLAAPESPNPGETRFRLAWILATAPTVENRDGAEAVRLAEALAQERGADHPAVLDLLGAAYAEAGRFEKAAEFAARAAQEARKRKQPDWATRIERRRDLYRRGKAFRSTR